MVKSPLKTDRSIADDTMIGTIARKEFLNNLMTYRFAFAFAACVSMMGLSAYALAGEFAHRVDAHQAQLISERAELDNIKVYAQLLEYPPYTYRPPSPLSIFSEGLDRTLGNILHFSHGYVPTMLTAPQESSPLTHAFPAFDLATVATLLLSLIALFFAYDSVSGERQAGTLSLLLTHPVPRSHVLLGKWLGGLLCTFLPTAAGFTVALLIVVGEPSMHFTDDEWLRLAVILAAAFLYLSVFYLVGLYLSIRVDRPATCLILGISIWVLFTVVLPTTSAYLVGELMPMDREAVARQERQAAERRIGYGMNDLTELVRSDGLPVRGRSGGGFLRDTMIGSGFHREQIPKIQAFYSQYELRRIAAAEEIGDLEDHVLADRIAQVELNRTIGRILITSAFTEAISTLAGTNLSSYRRFLDHTRRCRQNLIAWMRESDLFSSPRYFTTDDVARAATKQELVSLSDSLKSRSDLSPSDRRSLILRATGATDYREWDPIDLSQLPAFPPYRATLNSVLPDTAVDLVILVLANVLLLLFAVHGFLRQDLV